MPKRSSRQGGRPPRLYPPSLVGQCLRYAVMELLGFGRVISPEAMEAMQAGTRLHRTFQAGLADLFSVVAVEAPVKDVTRGVSGRLDAIVSTDAGLAVVEYKTVGGEKFARLVQDGPLVQHWAQLALYLDLTGYGLGFLVVESRETGERRMWRATPDPAWQQWVQHRVEAARAHQLAHRLPEREISRECLSCDRWTRCFKTLADRDQAVAQHPIWDPAPPLPQAKRGQEESVS